MKIVSVLGVLLAAIFAGLSQRSSAAPANATPGTRVAIAIGDDTPLIDTRATIATLESMMSAGALRSVERRDDPLVPERFHERYQQLHGGLPVLGADVAVQRRGGQIVSAIGVVYQGLTIDTSVHQPFAQIRSALAGQGQTIAQTTSPMSILPTADGGVSLVYSVQTDRDSVAYVDASSASILLELTQRHTQAAVGQGTGTLGDTKKISTTNLSGTFVSQDSLRPPQLQTFDLQGNQARAIQAIIGAVRLGTGDLARRADNTWTDGAVVDAHVHAGWVYDYYFRRFQRRGLDNNDVPILSVVHPVLLQNARTAPASLINDFYLNAFYDRRCRCVVYGEGIPAGLISQFPNGVRHLASALDLVGHELTHAVTDASSRLIYASESGALNEAFSDIMGTSVEFFYQQAGSGLARADYLLGEDLAVTGTGLMRSMIAPTTLDQPDHFSERAYIGAGTFDSGGVHVNSGIANNAFYLAIEGGQNRTSGRAVVGVGAANREQIERTFYRAFTAMLPSSGTFYMARVATLQSARDLYGAGSSAERAIAQAWDAVGVTSPAAALTTQFSPRSVTSSSVSCTGSTVRPSFTFRAAVSEYQGVGFTVDRFNIYSFDSAGRTLAVTGFSGADFRDWFGECQPGSSRIGARATACATVCGDLGGRSTGYALFEYIGRDDNGNPGVFNSDYLALGLPAVSDTDEGGAQPSFWKAGK